METSLHFATSCTRTLQGTVGDIKGGEGLFHHDSAGESEEVPWH